MKNTKLYDTIRSLLETNADLRDSDRELIWALWELEGFAGKYISKHDFIFSALNTETVRRTRQKVQENHPELSSSESALRAKNEKQETKGTFVYRETLQILSDLGC